jgi:hypothetical protein
MGTCDRELTEKPQVEAPRGREYGCAMAGAEQRVVAMKSPIKRWSEGAVSRGQTAGSTSNGRNSRASGWRAISHEIRSQLDGSRMTRECHVRLCVQQRLACSAGNRPVGAKVRSPVAWIAKRRETEFLKPIDDRLLGRWRESSGRNESERKGGLESE